MCLLAAIGVGLYFGFFSRQDMQNLGDTLRGGVGDVLGADPFAGLGGDGGVNGTVFQWRFSKGRGGLTLEILNALDDNWQVYFEQAVSDWQSGTPDALTLSTTRIEAESACVQVEGAMKVCNGKYGDTGWRGINELILTSANKIVSSVAKMNEFYLTSSTSELDKQYTMCHEIGHGFGLPHTDENFMNSPLGDCLDYSSSVSQNQKPGQVNYDKLAAVYGEVGSRRIRQRGQNSGIVDAMSKSRDDTLLERAKNSFREKVQAFQVGKENEGWTRIHQHPLGEIHVTNLGDGYRGQINVFLA
jgi:hypothetical protein